jgi:hypothetical protein
VDREIQAMGEIARALKGLDEEAARRVLKWAIDRFQLRAVAAISGQGGGAGSGSLPTRAFTDLPELFDAANPQTGLEKVLVVSYWFQVAQGQEEWDSHTVNKWLKQLGHPSGNITRDLDALIKRTPRLVLQVRKGGPSRQARKRYKLTREGIRAVETMLNVTAAPLKDVS